jgi:magnesium transporter
MAPTEHTVTSRRTELLSTSVRRLLRRKARGKISKMLAKVRPEDVAVMLRGFIPDELIGVFRILIADYPQAASDVLVAIDPQSRRTVLEQLTVEQVAKLIELAAVDDAVYLFDALPGELREKVRELVDLEERFAEVQEHLAYPDDTAGRIMDSELIAMSQDATAAEAIEHMRKIAHDVEMISYLYVSDENGRLVGVTPLRQLLLSDPGALLRDLMNSSIIKVGTHTDQEEVAQLASRYDLLAIPVVDDDGRLMGIVTVDDILDVFKEEATEDFYKMAGTTDQELVYQDRSFKVAGIRLPWILFNLIGLLGAGFAVSRFQEAFQMALLVGFIPVIMGMAGNIGSQTSTITVRGLATGRLSATNGRVRHFLWQQLKVGALLGVTCSLLVAAAAFAFDQNPLFALAVGTSLFATVQLASLTGVMVPVVFHRIGFDPAVASGPLVTTANDVLGILIYFGLTTTFFRMLGA